ncbi:MAG: SIS domain-containing protein [Chloroflexi bacterium]|nr:SIS domain-containing protein [Chloroflexota bacterium]
MKLTGGEVYFNEIEELIDRIKQSQTGAIANAAAQIANSIKNGGVLHIFGSGHGQGTSTDVFYRAGGFAPVNAILDVNLSVYGGGSPKRGTSLERLEGYAKIILLNYDLRPNETIIVLSNSGINAVPIEVAILAKKRGLKVIALTNVKQSQTDNSRHSSGKKLYEIADLVIDTCVVYGDACVEISPALPKVSAQSSIACCLILQMIMSETAAILYQEGITPPILTSANVPGGDENLEKIQAEFGGKRYTCCFNE